MDASFLVQLLSENNLRHQTVGVLLVDSETNSDLLRKVHRNLTSDVKKAFSIQQFALVTLQSTLLRFDR